jgi:hypothetical protein
MPAGHYWKENRSGMVYEQIAEHLAEDMGLEAKLRAAAAQLELPGIRSITDEQLRTLDDELVHSLLLQYACHDGNS